MSLIRSIRRMLCMSLIADPFLSSKMRLVKPPLMNWGIEVDRALEPEEKVSIFEEFKALNPFLQAEGPVYSFIEFWNTNESLILDVIMKSSRNIDI